MVSVQGTVELGASQLLVDGLEHSAMRWVLAVKATLSNGENQVSFFLKTLVQLWRPKEAMPEGSEPSPLNSRLDSFLERGEVHGLEVLQGLAEGDELARLLGADPTLYVWMDGVHHLPLFLGSEHLCTHNTWLPSVSFCCQDLENAMVLQL